jgi:uncharacterized membrane protein YfcA
LSGFLAGLLGGGGNIVVANALYKVLKVPFRRAVALSLCLGVLSAISGVLPYLHAGRVDLALAPWILIPALGLAWFSSGYAITVPIDKIRRGQGLYLVVVAVILAGRQLA